MFRPALRLTLLLAVGAALVLIPTAVLEAGPTLCVWKQLFGMDCPGCGMTRAFSHVCHARFADAWADNPMVVLVFPLMAGLAGRWAWRDVARLRAALARRAGSESV